MAERRRVPVTRGSTPGPLQKSTSSSTPSLPSIHKSNASTAKSGIYGRQWNTEVGRYLHEKGQRSWLRQQGKHAMVDFSESERAELQRYFEGIAEVVTGNGGRRIKVDRLEDMLISLGLAVNRREVDEIVKTIDDNQSGELDFEQYLTIVRTCADPAIFQVFKSMIDGTLGDRNLNFRTVISGYRRGMIMDATGARQPFLGEPEPDKAKKQEMEAAKKRGQRILDSFANLQKSRYDRGEKRGDRGETGEDSMPFDGAGFVPTGGMQMLWHTVCQEQRLVPSRPASADKRTLEPPRSPRDIIESIVQAKSKKPKRKMGTLVIGAPHGLGKAVSSPGLGGTSSRPGTQEGRRDISQIPIQPF